MHLGTSFGKERWLGTVYDGRYKPAQVSDAGGHRERCRTYPSTNSIEVHLDLIDSHLWILQFEEEESKAQVTLRHHVVVVACERTRVDRSFPAVRWRC